MAALEGHKEATNVLLKAGPSLSTVNVGVIKTSVKLRHLNNKPFK